MKIVVLTMLSFFVFFASYPPENSIIAESVTYARVIGDNTFLFKTAELSDSNKVFEIPKTYFVAVDGCESDYFYSANYMGVCGYVLKSDVKFVKEIPKKPFANDMSFRVYAQNGLTLRSSPTTANGLFNKITTVPFLDSNLQYIGAIEAEESVAYRGSTWYFCNYYQNDTCYQGYLYAGYCDMLSKIVENNEELTYITTPTFEKNQTAEKISATKKTSSSTGIIIIVAVCLPSILLLVLIFKPSRALLKAQKNKEKKLAQNVKPHLKASRHKDYYELD